MDMALRRTRLCAYLVNTLSRELGLGGFAITASGEYSEDWAERSDCWVYCPEGVEVARVYVDHFDKPERCSVVVGDLWQLVRSNRAGEFDPAEFGLARNEARNWMGDREPDLMVDMNLSEVELPYLGGLRRDIPRGTHKRRVRVAGSMRATQ